MNKSARRIPLLLLSIGLLASAPTFAQKHKGGDRKEGQRAPKTEAQLKEKREKVRSDKRTFLIAKLNLTTAEADALMPLLNELDDKRFALWRELEPTGRRLRQGDKTLTAEELKAFYEKTLDFHVKEAELERTYYLRAANVLSGERLVRLPWASKEFARRFFGKDKGPKR